MGSLEGAPLLRTIGTMRGGIQWAGEKSQGSGFTRVSSNDIHWGQIGRAGEAGPERCEPMKKSMVLLLVLGCAAGTAPAKTKKEAPLSQLFCHAQYVYVETYDGDLNPNVARQYPQDYDAVVGVQQRIQKWGRYTLVYGPQDADLVWVVWKERKGGNRLPGQPTQMPPVSMPQPSDPGTGQNPGGQGQPGAPGGPRQNPGGIGGPDGVGISNGGPEVGMVWPANDQLAVYMPQSDESLQSPIWKKSEKDGLSEPDMPLFGKIADAVDDACSNSTSGPK